MKWITTLMLLLAVSAAQAETRTPTAPPTTPTAPSATLTTSSTTSAAPATMGGGGGGGAADAAELTRRRASLKAEDVAGRLELARWCRDRQLWGPVGELAREALTLDPESKLAYGLLRDVDENVRLPIDTATAERLQKEFETRFGHPFKARTTRHFLIIYDAPDVFTNRQAGYLEKAYDSFLFWFNMKRLRPNFLERRLVVILFKERNDYLDYAKKVDGASLGWAAGYYSQRTNRATFFDDSTSPEAEYVAKRIEQLKKAVGQINDAIAQAEKQGQKQRAAALTAERTSINQMIFRASNRLGNAAGQMNEVKTVHEACHQLAFNTGIQKRLVAYPLWVAEGLATNFESEDRTGNRGPGTINPYRQTVIKEALKADGLIPLAKVLQYRPEIKTEEDLDLFYAEAWGLFHFLYKTQRPALEKFLQSYLALKPGEEISAAAQEKMFTDAFGDDLGGLERKWREYLKNLPAR